MGNNAVIVVMHDCLSEIADDPEFGRRLSDAIKAFSHRGEKPVWVPARGKRCRCANAAEVLSWDHASAHQIVVVHGNSGVRVSSLPDDGAPDEVVAVIEDTLRWRKRFAKDEKKRNAAETMTAPAAAEEPNPS